MASFQATTPNLRLGNLRAGATAAVTYSVTNVTPGTQRATYSVKPKDEQQQSWYTVAGDPASDFAPGATKQIVVTVGPPAGAAPQDYSFRLFVGLSGQEDSDFTMGPEVTYTVTKVQPKPFPWWIVGAAVLLTALVGGVIYAATRRPAPPAPTPRPRHSFIIIGPPVPVHVRPYRGRTVPHPVPST